MIFGSKPLHRSLLHSVLGWLPLAAGLTVMALFTYATIQQNYRQSADDPQIQIAEDVAAQVADGIHPLTLVPESTVNMATSLAPWLIVFDHDNRVLASNAVLDGKTPIPPPGVLNIARQTGQNRITWQPQPNVRLATVSVAVSHHDGEVVMAGRSLREVEQRESRLSVMVLGAWVVSLLGTLVAAVVVTFLL